ncbi:MAG TPA: cytochrome c3 family protein [Candidatus Sulfomarinibacteraceae bacterium]|nr:cytochrome c3 family protein [Candidatus Sulfomarinibacteraceae bacterium]
MARQRPRVLGELVKLVAALVLAAAPGGAPAAEHPTLVDPGSTDCATCHDELLEVAVHPPAVDDCLTCHEFERTGEGTSVELVEAGAALCLACHDGLGKAAAGQLEAPHAPVVDDCGSCHDAHGTGQRALLVEPPEELCLTCHDADATDSLHPIPVRRGDCGSCHDPHGADSDHMLRGTSRHLPFAEGSCDACHRQPRGTRVRLLREGGELCAACHGDMGGGVDPSGRHTAVRQGRCTACHDPHLADRPNLLKADGGELCFSCHPEVADAAKGPGAHPILEEGCDGCHDPHASEHSALLVDDADDLCRACHDAGDAELAERHLDADMTTARCGGCHDPHGSRTRPLIARGSVHAPFRDGCSSCHEGTAKALQGGGGNDLCAACHDDVVESASTATFRHAAMDMAECVDCHSPHASRQPSLLRSAGGGVCLTCHEGQAGGAGEAVHGAVAWIGCRSCHLPHGGSQENLLRATGNELCVGCHSEAGVRRGEDGKVRLPGGFELRGERALELSLVGLDPSGRAGHPMPGHPVAGPITGDGRTEVAEALIGREMSCRICHEPHAAKSEALFTWQATTRTELCLACHPK